jgi:hypothetical protein
MGVVEIILIAHCIRVGPGQSCCMLPVRKNDFNVFEPVDRGHTQHANPNHPMTFQHSSHLSLALQTYTVNNIPVQRT